MTPRIRILAALAVSLSVLSALAPARTGIARPAAPATFAAFVDQYLLDFARRHPSIAAGNGIHDFDGTLDDFAASAVTREIAELKMTRATLRTFRASQLTPDERVDQQILDGVIDGWLLEQETLQNWKRNPMLYASALSDGVHNLMTMTNAPAPVRMRRIISKLAGVPALLAAARTNIVNPPRLFAERGAAMMKGTSGMLANDVTLAFASEKGTPLMDSLSRALTTARPLVDAYVTFLERDVIPKATGSALIGGEAVARRYRAEELIDVPLDTLVHIGERELAKSQADFRAAAAKLAPGREAQAAWQEVRKQHPKRGEVVAAAQRVVDSLTAFVRAKHLADIPTNEQVKVAAALPFDLGLASMHASPPLEKTPVQSVFYITDANAEQSPAEQDAWLERFNYASLTNTAAHEAMPGHWLHSQFMRQTPGKVRRIWIGLNPFPQPSSGQDGWAHYAEQLVVDQGYANGDPRFQLAQLSDALTRICRLLSGIHVHRGEWTLARAQQCFEQDAYVAAPAAKREAERATYDPTYGGYFLGKRGLLTLRRDVQAKEGALFDLRAFHERILKNGIAPIWAHRQLMLPGDNRPVIQ
jgi:uncharacterized protein (DUF885 family)